MSRKRTEKKDKSDKGGVEDPSKSTGLTTEENPLTFDDYQCSGNLTTDFPELCVLLGMKECPVICTKRPASASPADERGGTMEDSQPHMETSSWCPKPHVQVELENEEDPHSVKSIRILGWKVDTRIGQVLSKALPSLNNLQSLHLWHTGLTDQMVISLKNTMSLCSNLRSVVLEGDPLPRESYHILLSQDSAITHLSLRNNRLGDEGARLIGSALSTTRSANKNLVSLNLAFNCIGDEGATHIAQGLRLNRALLCLSLSNNWIGDTGAAHLVKILCPFALTHEEVVERRKLLQEREQSPSLVPEQSPVDQTPSVQSSASLSGNTSSKAGNKGTSRKKEMPKKEEKSVSNQAGAKKEDPKSTKKTSDAKVPRGKPGKPGAKEKQPSMFEQEDKTSASLNKLVEMVEVVSPLLEPSVQHKDGEVILLGNSALASLNLAGNRLTDRSLPLFLSCVQKQTEGGGLLRLSLQRNHFSPDCESYMQIQEIMKQRDPLTNNTAASQTEDERQSA